MARILVAENNQTAAAWLAAKLKAAGHSVRLTDHALGAWRAIGEESFDAVMTSVTLPGVAPFVLAQRALQENPAAQVIFLTGFSGAAMDTGATPSYAPAPVTLPPFHLSHINTRLRWLLGQGGSYDTARANVKDAKVIEADFTPKAREGRTA